MHPSLRRDIAYSAVSLAGRCRRLMLARLAGRYGAYSCHYLDAILLQKHTVSIDFVYFGQTKSKPCMRVCAVPAC